MKRDITILLIVSCVLLLVNLGAGSLSSWDEAVYAQVSREMFRTGDWIDLRWGGSSWSDKPPLYMWLTAFFYCFFGVNEFSARLFSALCGMGVIIVTYLLGRKLFSRRTGLLAAIMMMSTYHFVWFSKMGTLDVAFTLFSLLSVYFFLLAGKDRVNMIYSAIAFSLAFLTKGGGALLIPIAFGLYVLVRRDWRLVVNRYTLIGAAIFLVTVGGWYFAVLRCGHDVVKGHFFQHLVHRTVTVMDGHQGNLLTYINVVLYKGKPWGFLALASLPFFIYRTLKKREFENLIIISWILVVLFVFTAVRTKLHWYIMPVYPAMMVVAAWSADWMFGRRSVPVVAVIAFLCIVYFGVKKDIFSLDFNPEVKGFSEKVTARLAEGQDVYLYNVADPGMMYYFGGVARNVHNERLEPELAVRKGVVIVTTKEEFDSSGVRGKLLASSGSGYVAVVTE